MIQSFPDLTDEQLIEEHDKHEKLVDQGHTINMHSLMLRDALAHEMQVRQRLKETKMLTDLDGVLRAAGLTVFECDGWRTRGHGNMNLILGVLCHDTAGRAPPDDRSDLDVVLNGRADLAGPLANLFLARSGAFWTVAAGKGWHAGYGVVDGRSGVFNANLIGIEAENQGVQGSDPWPEVQVDAYARGCAALGRRYCFDAAHVLGHKEYALPPGRKTDPDFDMPGFRARVAALLPPSSGTV